MPSSRRFSSGLSTVAPSLIFCVHHSHRGCPIFAAPFAAKVGIFEWAGGPCLIFCVHHSPGSAPSLRLLQEPALSELEGVGHDAADRFGFTARIFRLILVHRRVAHAPFSNCTVPHGKPYHLMVRSASVKTRRR